jgi:hypothetical protein
MAQITATHRFVMPHPIAGLLDADVPEWKMTTAQWVAYQERLYGADWRAVIERMDADAADSAFYDWFGEPYDAAPDLTAYNRITAGMAAS